MLHAGLTKEQWASQSFLSQMANVGVEIGRTINWREKSKEKSSNAFERGIELLDLTIEDEKNMGHLHELCRLKEVLVDYFLYDNSYDSNDEKWNSYFSGFANAAVAQKT